MTMEEEPQQESPVDQPTSETEAVSEAETPSAGSELSQLKAELEKKNREIQELSNKYLRTYAEFENYKKRASKDQAELIRYASEPLLRELLAVLDNLSRAKTHGESSSEMTQWIEGVSLTIKQFEDILARFDVRPVQALGVLFDPAVHQAMVQLESDQPEGTVVEEFQKGYLFHDRVLRPALVAVAKKRSSDKTKSDVTEEEGGVNG